MGRRKEESGMVRWNGEKKVGEVKEEEEEAEEEYRRRRRRKIRTGKKKERRRRGGLGRWTHNLLLPFHRHTFRLRLPWVFRHVHPARVPGFHCNSKTEAELPLLW